MQVFCDDADVWYGDGVTGVGAAASTYVQAAAASNGNNEVTHILIPGGRKEDEERMKISHEDFRADEGGTPEWNFVGMMEFGQSYLDLPVPRKLTTPRIRDLELVSILPKDKIEEINKKRSEACNILKYVSPEYLSVMANSDIGLGTDPERLEEHILNKKKQVLVRKIFATCLFTLRYARQSKRYTHSLKNQKLSNGKKIDFGIAGGFEGVQLEFQVANETLDFSHERRVTAIADLRYQWGTTEVRIHHDKLYKFLTKDCKDALEKINKEKVDSEPELSRELSHFIGKYGTHVVLKCTHGYRMEKVESESVSSVENLKTFKAGIMASVLDYAGINVEYQKQALKAAKRTDSSLGIKNIGSKEHMKEALEGGMGINFENMVKYSAEEGDAGVISHDWNMMIAEMLLVEGSPYNTAAKRLRYWTQVRINDLKAGWDGGLFSVSYELKFEAPPSPFMGKIKEKMKNFYSKYLCRKHNEHKLAGRNCVCVTIGGLTVVHEHPGNDTDCVGRHVTNIHTNEAKSVRISVLDDHFALKDVLAKITIFKRFVADDGAHGIVLKTEIPTGCVTDSEREWDLLDVPIESKRERLQPIEKARAKVC